MPLRNVAAASRTRVRTEAIAKLLTPQVGGDLDWAIVQRPGAAAFYHKVDRNEEHAQIGARFMSHAPEAISAPFHVHGALFRVLSIEGEPPPPYLAGWKDTLLVEDKAELLVAFNQRATRDRPFMYHCHILEHEDAGLMGQYVCAWEATTLEFVSRCPVSG
jgi:hypothetical protein